MPLAQGLFHSEDDGAARCSWCQATPAYRHYHDHEWGFPVTDDRRLFEKICLEGFQSGLSWLTILNKRENFRHAFDQFDAERVARYSQRDVDRLLGDAGIAARSSRRSTTPNAYSRCVESSDLYAPMPGATNRPQRRDQDMSPGRRSEQ